jgi:DNA (cytosine-5)-methyltransferase 1
MKVLNLFAGIGGNRRLWRNVEVTAVEINPQIAGIYQDFFPKDEVIIGDAHSFLLENYAEFDFIWASPPCQTHSRIRQFVGVNAKGFKPLYPDMTLYQEIIFLQHNAKGLWVVENVNPFYVPLIPAKQIGRHLVWSNFEIPFLQTETQNLRERNSIAEVESLHNFDLSDYRISDKRQILRNCVDSELGLHILQSALGVRIEMPPLVTTDKPMPLFEQS